MAQTGTFSLGDVAITTAATYIGDWVDGFDGVSAITIDLMFAYGSGGTSGTAYVQTSTRQATATTDAGIDVAAMSFTTASKRLMFEVSRDNQTTGITPTDGAMSADTCQGKILGDRFRIKVVTLGVYATNTIMSARIDAAA